MRDYRENPERRIIHDIGMPSPIKATPRTTASNTAYYGLDNPHDLPDPEIDGDEVECGQEDSE